VTCLAPGSCAATEVPNSDKASARSIPQGNQTTAAVNVTCNPGYTAAGSMLQVSCENTTGAYTSVSCQAVACAATQVPNSDMSMDGIITGDFGGTAVPVTCDPGYTGTGDATCGVNGTFSTVTCAAAPVTVVTLTQVVTFANLTIDDYVGVVQSTYELGYANANNLTTTTNGVIGYTTGVNVSSSAARRSVSVTFVVTIADSFAGPIPTVSTTAVVDGAAIATGIQAVVTANDVNGSLSTVNVPTGTDVLPAAATVALAPTSAPTVTPSSNTPSSNGTTVISSAPGIGHFSHIVLSIPVVAMVISKMC